PEIGMGGGQRTIRVFVSYSHKDKELFDVLDEHLASLKREQLIEAWTDRHIIPGDDWNAEIAHELEKAD
ncbi:MAG TPA: toll/interleukin-1 receptor domain-containing protein, partial [Sphingomicrobium sp.]|nr:toll/interleukin-1 receptor domain-containing protein [Sphingomicrobium sp.]